MAGRSRAISLVLLAGSAPFFIFPSPGRAWVLLLGCAPLIISAISEHRLVRPSPVDVPLGLLAVSGLANLFMIKDLGSAMGKLSGFAFGLIALYILRPEFDTASQAKGS